MKRFGSRRMFASGRYYLWVAAFLLGLLPVAGWAQTRSVAPLLVISIDGMRPDYVTHADEHGVKIPTLRAFLKEGTWAEGVINAMPTVTYPNHTTMITGVWPAEHGIYANAPFDPLHPHSNILNENFSAIRVETIFQAAKQAGLKTAAVGWPVTLGAPIDYNIAEDAESERTDKPDGPPYNPPDLLTQIGVKGSDKDEVKVQQTIAILQKFKPDVMFMHFNDLDHQEHLHGPFSAEADATLETIDGQVAAIEDAALKINPATRVVIVSDHGFQAVTHYGIDLNAFFEQQGLIKYQTDAKTGEASRTVTDWTAEALGTGGCSFIMLRDPKDVATVDKVRSLLQQAKAKPENGIGQILERDEIAKFGGTPNASFFVVFADGYKAGGGHPPKPGKPIQEGQHGYLPSNPSMHASFFMKGPGIAASRDLHLIDMRQIAPTFAEMLGVTLPAAKQKPVHYKP